MKDSKEIKLKFVELIAPLFLGGKNFGNKLDPNKTSGLEMHYNRFEKELIVRYQNSVAIIPTSNVGSMTVVEYV